MSGVSNDEDEKTLLLLEQEIEDLKRLLSQKKSEALVLRERLNLSAFGSLKNDIQDQIGAIKDSSIYVKTNQKLTDIQATISNSEAVKNIQNNPIVTGAFDYLGSLGRTVGTMTSSVIDNTLEAVGLAPKDASVDI